MAQSADLLETIQHSVALRLDGLMIECDYLSDVEIYRDTHLQISVFLQRRYLRNQIRVLQQLDKVIRAFKTFLAFVSQRVNMNLLALFAPDSVVVKLDNEVQCLLVRLQEFCEIDTLSRQFLSQSQNN